MRQISLPGEARWIGEWVLPLDIFFVIALVLGFKTRLSAVVHYLLFVWLVAPAARDEYHFDYVMAYFGMLFMFAPSPKCLSIDSKLEGVSLPRQLIPSWFFFAFTMAIWQYYFDSLIYKFQSVLWTRGEIVYFAALPYRTCFSFSQLFEFPLLVYFLSYFSFLFFFRFRVDLPSCSFHEGEAGDSSSGNNVSPRNRSCHAATFFRSGNDWSVLHLPQLGKDSKFPQNQNISERSGG